MIPFSTNKSEENEFQDNELVCFCFGYMKKDIEIDFKDNGYSKVLQKIKTEKMNKGCNCEVKNPKGK